MARRASSSTNPTLIIGIVVAIIAVFIAGKFFMTKKTNTFADENPLSVQDLLENGNSLRGNVYTIQGKIDDKLRWTSDRGQFVSVRVKTKAGEEIIPVQIPQEFSKLNIEREQNYAFKIEFQQGGIPVATDVSRL
ncbi:hypothetical protein [Luteolibacter sp. AS25]|uniref:hypothetical protein n=1 Tax=Luteolibacter sp. AS25 TaxID=3135776 RepID=UPI00398B91F5